MSGDLLRCGTVAIAGRPNAGKSTLLNALVGESLSIVSPRPETTRDAIRAVVTRDGVQIVFADTPGLHRPHGRLGDYMLATARETAGASDAIVWVSDVTEGAKGLASDRKAMEAHLGDRTDGLIVALTKVDLVRAKSTLLPILQAWGDLGAEVVPVSGKSGDGLERLWSVCAGRVKGGEFLFPADALTDRSVRWLAGEWIREAVLFETEREVPYVTAIEVEHWDERSPVVRIRANIHVERQGQKKIVVGKGGEKLKAIGWRARQAIESLMDRQVVLELWVRVTPGWTSSDTALGRLGYSPVARGGTTG